MSYLKPTKERKIEDVCRVFNKEMCHETVLVFKEYNSKWHFQTKHANFGNNLSKQELQKKATDLVKSLKQQQTVFEKTSSLQRNATKPSFY